MKKYFPIIALAALSACSNEENIPIEANQIRLTSAINTRTRISDLDVQSTQIEPGQEVGIIIRGGLTPHENIGWTVGTSGELTNTGDPIYWNEKAVQVYAYHPYNGYSGNNLDENPIFNFTVNVDQSGDGYLQSDLMWATATSEQTENAIALNFEHKLVKINIILENDETKDVDFSTSNITLCDADVHVNVEYFTGELIWDWGSCDILAGTNTMQASAIIVPQTANSGKKFIKVENQGKTYYHILNNDISFESGKEYTFKLALKETTLICLNETVKDWADEGTSEGGLTEYVDPAELSRIPFDATQTELTYSGELGGNEIYVLRKMLGCEEFEESERGQLHTLDLSEARIIEEGGSYMKNLEDKIYTKDDVVSERMFMNCSNLKSIKLPNSVNKIEFGAFLGCPNLSTITLPDRLEVIEGYAFSYTGLTDIVLPESLREIPNYAFCEMEKLASINIPDGVSRIGENIFANSSIPKVTISENQIILTKDSYGVLYTKDMRRLIAAIEELTEYQIPETVTEIDASAFRNSQITTIKIPEGVNSLSDYIFGNSALTEVTLPSSLVWIGMQTFANTPLEVVHCHALTPPRIEWSTFDSPDATLYVPAESIEAYQNSFWGDYFTNIMAEPAAE